MSGAIWLASYPRSGNTWTRMALYSLRHGGAEVDFEEVGSFGHIASGREHIDRMLEVDTASLTGSEIEELRPDAYAVIHSEDRPPELSKVHDAWGRTPSGRPTFDRNFTHATIYLIRDPRDVAVSWARFSGCTLQQSVDFMCSPDARLAPAGTMGAQLLQKMGSWSDHAASWIDQSGLDPLVIRYEDMLADPAQALRRMAALIGWEAPEDAVERAVQRSRFERLAAKERIEGFRERGMKTERFFHTGKSGTWRSILSPEQSSRLEREHRAMMMRFGYLGQLDEPLFQQQLEEG